ncbi:hypothetical protein [Janthinobacterium fluminis]|uniref:Lantibiotic n=1 Tax=Janthinobacterium fluminis TaxID=2987524 RepID=A0ABT5K7H3_9BURK|nr:hypothetical protein [Janthinobacterium fluminis]MDC8760953.1 hypothetical protein [Janthinobacterium fluminis]
MSKKNVLNALVQSDSDQSAMTESLGMVEIKEELLHQVSGGLAWSSGYICTVSGECSGGRSCWPRWPHPSDKA